mgnify:CR=1 FL=1
MDATALFITAIACICATLASCALFSACFNISSEFIVLNQVVKKVISDWVIRCDKIELLCIFDAIIKAR